MFFRINMPRLHENPETLIVSWPVDASMNNLRIPFQHILSKNKLDDVTWHDVPSDVWNGLSTEEKTQLKKDVWHFARLALDADTAKAAASLGTDLKNTRDEYAEQFGVTFAFPDGSGSEEDAIRRRR